MTAVGVPAADAEKVAELMLRGRPHRRRRAWRVPSAAICAAHRRAASIRRRASRSRRPRRRPRMVDGDNGMGHLVMRAPPRPRSSSRARAASAGSARGAATTPARPASTRRCRCRTAWSASIGVVANANHMPVWGAVESLLGTNPIAIAIPAGEEAPVVLDIATTVVSYGTVKAYGCRASRCRKAGWSTPRTASRSPIPRKSGEGVLLPIGGHKG